MSLNSGCEDKYRSRHDNLWPELRKTLKSHGVHNYSIALCKETSQLFAYAEVDSEEQWNRIAKTEACRKWWAYMSDIMATNADNSPQSIALDEVFYLE